MRVCIVLFCIALVAVYGGKKRPKAKVKPNKQPLLQPKHKPKPAPQPKYDPQPKPETRPELPQIFPPKPQQSGWDIPQHGWKSKENGADELGLPLGEGPGENEPGWPFVELPPPLLLSHPLPLLQQPEAKHMSTPDELFPKDPPLLHASPPSSMNQQQFYPPAPAQPKNPFGESPESSNSNNIMELVRNGPFDKPLVGIDPVQNAESGQGEISDDNLDKESRFSQFVNDGTNSDRQGFFHRPRHGGFQDVKDHLDTYLQHAEEQMSQNTLLITELNDLAVVRSLSLEQLTTSQTDEISKLSLIVAGQSLQLETLIAAQSGDLDTFAGPASQSDELIDDLQKLMEMVETADRLLDGDRRWVCRVVRERFVMPLVEDDGVQIIASAEEFTFGLVDAGVEYGLNDGINQVDNDKHPGDDGNHYVDYNDDGIFEDNIMPYDYGLEIDGWGSASEGKMDPLALFSEGQSAGPYPESNPPVHPAPGSSIDGATDAFLTRDMMWKRLFHTFVTKLCGDYRDNDGIPGTENMHGPFVVDPELHDRGGQFERRGDGRETGRRAGDRETGRQHRTGS